MCKLEGVWGRGGRSTVFNLGCRWSLAASCTPRLIYPGGSPPYVLSGSLFGEQSQCGHLENDTHFLHSPGTRHLYSQLIRELLWNLEEFYVAETSARNLIYDMIYLLTATGLTPGGRSTVHIYTQALHRTTLWKENIQNRTYITIRMHKHNNKNT